MRFLLIAYSAGVLLVGVVPALVDWRVMALLLGLLCALAGGVLWGRGVKLTAGGWRLVLVMGAFLLGTLWHFYWGGGLLEKRVPVGLEGGGVTVRGYVAGLPDVEPGVWRFLFVTDEDNERLPGRRLILSRYGEDYWDRMYQYRGGVAWGAGKAGGADGDGGAGTAGEGTVRADEAAAARLIRGGRCLQLRVRLRRPNGTANPGAFDYEAWLARNRIHGSGHLLREPEAIECVGFSPGRILAGLRQGMAVALQQAMQERGQGRGPGRGAQETQETHETQQTQAKPLEHSGLIMALVLGSQSTVDPGQWDLFNATGTTHLFVVSGLHVALVAGFAFAVMRLLWGLSPALSNLLPAQRAAAVAGLAAAFGYGALSGFGLPAQRALVMLGCVLAGQLSGVNLSASLRLLTALAIVLSINPLAPNGGGFWLSFVAVAALLSQARPPPVVGMSLQQRPLHRRLWERASELLQKAVQPQWRIAVALAVPLLLWTQSASVMAPVVNLLAIPMMGILVLPAAMIALCIIALSGPPTTQLRADALVSLTALSEQRAPQGGSDVFATLSEYAEVLAGVMLQVADWGLGWMVEGLAAVHGYPPLLPLHLRVSPGVMTLLFGAAAALLLLGPRRLFSPALVLALLLPALLPRERGLAAGVGWEVHVLDVGQGTAVVVRAADKWLVYDTGPALPSGFDAGEAVLVPVLRHLGARRVDVLVLSHGDSDHAGGAASLLEEMPVGEIYSGDVLPGLGTARPCHSGQSWRWGEVEFRFLHPPQETSRRYRGNDRSCVLLISGGGYGVLLPGDISAGVERELVRRHGPHLKSYLLLSPHHGSATSSTYTFIKWVDPAVAVHSAGYRNRFGHPAPTVAARYRVMESAQYTTHQGGRLRLRFSDDEGDDGDHDGSRPRLSLYRDERRRYWQLRP